MTQDQGISISELTRPPAAKFEDVGDRVKGVITRAARQQQTDLDTGELMVWANGDPRMQTVIAVQQADGTEVTLYARGGNYTVETGEGTAMEKAIVDAVVAAKADAIKVGATLEVVHSGLGKAAKRGVNQPKLYRARYVPPAAPDTEVPVSGLFSDDTE